MTVKIAIRGLDSFKRNLARLGQLQGLDAALDQSANEVLAEAAENLDQLVSENSSGRLGSSLVVARGDRDFSRTIGTSLNYGAFLEFGTLQNPPRPWLSTALTSTKAAILKRLRAALVSPVSNGNATAGSISAREE